jgi:hypothetical protein
MGNFTDLSGKKFNNLLVLEKTNRPAHVKNTNAYFLCLCDCGKQTIVCGSQLKNNKTKTCGCSKLNDLTNKKFGKVTVLGRASKPDTRSKKARDSFWLCLCECGAQKIFAGGDIQKLRFKGCGCSRKNNTPYEAKMGTAKIIYKHRYSDGDLSFEDFLLLANKQCHYCGEFPTRIFNPYKIKYGNTKLSEDNGHFIYNGLDRIDNNLLHSKNNVVPCCWNCNAAKRNLHIDDFMKWIMQITKFNKDKLIGK